jgi:hypothetical protein
MPGKTAAMKPAPDHGETSYKGSGRLGGKKAVITGGDSGIGRAVAIAYAREGADILISYLNEHDDARETERLVTEAGRKAVLLPGDIQEPGQCRAIIAKAVSDLGGIDILVNNAAHQASFKSIDDISDEAFKQGLAARSASLGDPVSGEGSPDQWVVGAPEQALNGLMILTGPDAASVTAIFDDINALANGSWDPTLFDEAGKTRALNRGHEHFGFKDGVSQPGIRGDLDDRATPCRPHCNLWRFLDVHYHLRCGPGRLHHHQRPVGQAGVG